jgi:hypothetical protein
MRAKSIVLLLLAAPLLVSAAAFAETTEDDVTWVNQCIADNKKEGTTEDVVRTYCVCMNNKMPTTESQSVTEWEKTHQTEQAECDKEAGWK